MFIRASDRVNQDRGCEVPAAHSHRSTRPSSKATTRLSDDEEASLSEAEGVELPVGLGSVALAQDRREK